MVGNRKYCKGCLSARLPGIRVEWMTGEGSQREGRWLIGSWKRAGCRRRKKGQTRRGGKDGEGGRHEGRPRSRRAWYVWVREGRPQEGCGISGAQYWGGGSLSEPSCDGVSSLAMSQAPWAA